MGVELSDVYEAAVENTPRILPYEIKSMGDIILEMLSDDTNEDGVCEEGFYGGTETDILTDKHGRTHRHKSRATDVCVDKHLQAKQCCSYFL